MDENIFAIENNLENDALELQLAENKDVDETDDLSEENAAKKRKLLEKTKITKQTWSISEIHQKIQRGELILDPDFQRAKVWGPDKKTAFIESLYMEIMIPPIYVVEIPNNNLLSSQTYEVVDGKQRLSSILDFISNKLILSKKYLEYYSDIFGGRSFHEIYSEHPEETQVMLSSVLDIYVITATSPEFTKYDIFSRLNKGAAALKVNEIRRAIYHSNVSKTIMDYVESYTNEKANKDKQDEYKKYFSPNDIKRFEDYGRFYRSVAFYLRFDATNHKIAGYNSRPRDMINTVLQELQEGTTTLDNETTNKIITATLKLLDLFKDNNYKDYLVDSCIPFAVDDLELISQKVDKIITDSEVLKSLEKSPGTTSNVNCRIERIQSILNEGK